MEVVAGSQLEQLILSACAEERFPSDDEFAQHFVESDGKYLSYEGACWDFKRSLPSSYSDEYFHSLARAIAGFANAFGGFLVFGVDDESRKGGNNEQSLNADKFIQALSALIGSRIALRFRSYHPQDADPVIVLLVPPRPARTSPIKIADAKTGKQRIWIREGHQVVTASPRHFDTLFLRSGNIVGDLDSSPSQIEVAIPPSPATVRKFVGRTQALTEIFHWVFSEDRPRLYLWGKGGSGKSTIAWEFARLMRAAPDLHVFNPDESLDAVIFLTAKEKSLNSLSAVSEDVQADFSDKGSLFRAILSHSGWITDTDELEKWTEDYLKKELKKYFDEFSALIIIDDIDTLTTKGLDSGDEDLFFILSRAKRTSKILYTLRNAPTHALGSAVEVPGLEPNGEYEEFVELCAKHFGVPAPTDAQRDSDLALTSERRPLVVESILALRRSTGTLQKALQVFREQAGADVRRYVFVREWIAIAQPADGRLVLAVLALLGRPALFEELETILQMPDDRVRDGIAQVREMFLEISHLGEVTKFGLAALTKAFVLEQAAGLDQFLALKTRVRDFKSKMKAMSPAVAHIAARVEACFDRSSDLRTAGMRALTIVNDPSLPVEVREDSYFRAIVGYVCARQEKPTLVDCRAAFQNAMQMRREIDARYLRAWFEAERDSQMGFDYCRRICEYVIDHRAYTAAEKRDFLGLKATTIYYRARASQALDMETAMSGFFEALTHHLVLFKSCEDDNCGFARVSVNARNTCYSWVEVGCRLGRQTDLLKSLTNLLSRRDLYADPVEDPILQLLAQGSLTRGERGELHQRARILDDLAGVTYAKNCWSDPAVATRISAAANDVALKVKAAARPN